MFPYRSPIAPTLGANASGWIRSIGADLNISQQERAQRPQCHSSNSTGPSRGSWKRLHTVRDRSRLEMAGCVRLRRDGLQPGAQANQERDVVARRVRTTADFESGRRLEN